MKNQVEMNSEKREKMLLDLAIRLESLTDEQLERIAEKVGECASK